MTQKNTINGIRNHVQKIVFDIVLIIIGGMILWLLKKNALLQ